MVMYMYCLSGIYLRLLIGAYLILLLVGASYMYMYMHYYTNYTAV